MLYQLSYASEDYGLTAYYCELNTNCIANCALTVSNERAGDGTRTRGHKLGRLVLYQLSYSRTFTTKNPPLKYPWWGKDSNLRRRKPADLQSAPVGHLGTPPDLGKTAAWKPEQDTHLNQSAELTGRIELPTC